MIGLRGEEVLLQEIFERAIGLRSDRYVSYGYMLMIRS